MDELPLLQDMTGDKDELPLLHILMTGHMDKHPSLHTLMTSGCTPIITLTHIIFQAGQTKYTNSF